LVLLDASLNPNFFGLRLLRSPYGKPARKLVQNLKEKMQSSEGGEDC
jgi:hypothetical protein